MALFSRASCKLTNVAPTCLSNNFVTTFSDCISLTYVNLPNRCYSLQESQYRGIFRGCNNAYNYDSIPESWKSW